MTSATLTLTPATRAPRMPLAAAWKTLARRPAIWWILVAWLAQSIGFGLGFTYGSYVSFKTSTEPYAAQALEEMQKAMELSNLASYSAGSVPFFGAATAVVLGALAIGYDYTHRTAPLLASQGPTRGAIFTAQVISLVAMTGVYTVVTYLANGVGLAVIDGIEGWPIEAPPVGELAVTLGASWLSFTAFALVGAALATVFRSAITALAAGLVWTMAVETIILYLGQLWSGLAHVATFTLGGATSNLAVARGAFPWWPGAPQQTATAADGWIAAGVLVGWSLVCLAVSYWAWTKRDV